MFLYLPIEAERNSPSIGRYRTFGLRVLQNGETAGKEILVLPDISTDFAFTLHLAGLFTENQLDPLHLMDVLEDLL